MPHFICHIPSRPPGHLRLTVKYGGGGCFFTQQRLTLGETRLASGCAGFTMSLTS